MAVVVITDPKDYNQAMPLMLNAGTSLGLSGPSFDVTDNTGAVLKSDREWPSDVEKVPLPFVDTGAFVAQLTNRISDTLQYTEEEKSAIENNPDTAIHIVQEKRTRDADGTLEHQVQQATYRSTRVNLTKFYDIVEQR